METLTMTTTDLIFLAFSLASAAFVFAILMWSSSNPWFNSSADAELRDALERTRVNPHQENGR
jgi:hypothetical protein